MKKVVKFQDIMSKEIIEYHVTRIVRNQGDLMLFDGDRCIKVLMEFYYKLVK